MTKTQAWLHAFRLRTLPLSFSSILSGGALAWLYGAFSNVAILYLALLTTLFLQILSNLANDYGDSKNGIDNTQRIGPTRAVQSGVISSEAMKKALILFSILSFASGSALLSISFSLHELPMLIGFIGAGLLAIWASIKYTVGKKPYGYQGLGDIFVFLFFGVVGVCGTFFLFAKTILYDVVLWSFAIGCFSTAVLNLNNMRDIENDKASGKISIPVRLGLAKAKIYHYFLITSGVFFAFFVILSNQLWFAFLAVPIFIHHLWKVQNKSAAQLDPELKRVALATFFISLLLIISVLFYK